VGVLAMAPYAATNVPNGVLIAPIGASIAAMTSVPVAPVGHRLPNGVSSRSSANSSNHVDSSVKPTTDGVLVMLVSASITMPFGSNCMVSNSSMLVVSTDISPGVDPNRLARIGCQTASQIGHAEAGQTCSA